MGADRRAQPRCRGRAGRGGPDRTAAARCGARRRVRFDDRVRADPIEWWRWRRWAERASHHGDRRARGARRAPFRVRLGNRDRAAADRDPVDPHDLPARPRAGAGDQRQLPGRVPGRRAGARGRGRLLAATDHPLARGTRRRMLQRGGDPRRRPHGRSRSRPKRSDRRRRTALARGAAGAVPAKHRSGWDADPARRDHGSRHPAASDPRRVGPSARQTSRAVQLERVQPPVGVLGEADRAPPLGRRRRWTRGRDRPRASGSHDEHRPAASELARRKRPAGPDPPGSRAPGRAERRRLPDPGTGARWSGRRPTRDHDRGRDTRRLHRACSRHLRVPAWR